MSDLTAKQKKIAQVTPPRDEITSSDLEKLRKKDARTSKERDDDTTSVPKELSAQEQAKTKKKYGGKITFRMTGGQVVDSSYD